MNGEVRRGTPLGSFWIRNFVFTGANLISFHNSLLMGIFLDLAEYICFKHGQKSGLKGGEMPCNT